MKLAEALAHKGRLDGRMADLKARMAATLTHEEGSAPLESFDNVRTAYLELAEELRVLEHNISVTNRTTRYRGDNGPTLADLLIDRADVGRKRAFAKQAADGVRTTLTRRGFGYGAKELKTIVAVDITELDAEVETLNERWADLDGIIQATNWETDLITS